MLCRFGDVVLDPEGVVLYRQKEHQLFHKDLEFAVILGDTAEKEFLAYVDRLSGRKACSSSTDNTEAPGE